MSVPMDSVLQRTCADFASSLLDAAGSSPCGLQTWNGSDPAQRFSIYRNNVTVSLVDALADTFPVVQSLVGEAFFRAMAREFVRSAPPKSAVLANYGQGFADFVAAFSPAASLVYLADMARLEMARVQVFNALDADAAQPAQVGAALAACLAQPEQLPSLRFVFQASLVLLSSPYAVASLWLAHQDESLAALSEVNVSQAEQFCLLRRPASFDVELHKLSAHEFSFISALAQGDNLACAVAQAMKVDATSSSFNLTETLSRLIRMQAIAALQSH